MKSEELEILDHIAKLSRSEDYKERFLAEYMQLTIRYNKLENFLAKIRVDELTEFTVGHKVCKHDCPYSLLKEQADIMKKYLDILRMRAIIENIDLDIIK